ncbi:Cell division septal protein FtsQ [Sulfurivirga caldicuralii]|uniref:Cell division septal protein FtsQ n=1 Tax=Sulfurivirga caldicuralii TaxID=364032 RepID=A0A1N6DW68_9GAMM|nr:FtsQ-type POTRA domain-containing protein [Sulfurivirga caldicuralii]SIN74934.1 Cell division septal protein FtsQ [Sulfurivirga caldicuralii]
MKRLTLIWTLLALLLFAGIYTYLGTQQIERIRIEVQGEHLSAEALRPRVEAWHGARFWSLDLQQVREAVIADPWVAKAQAWRVWPHTLVVRATAEVPVARWDNAALVDRRGHVFYPPEGTQAFANLLRLDGPDPKAAPALLELAVRLSRLAPEWGLTRLEAVPGGSVLTYWSKQHPIWLEQAQAGVQLRRLQQTWDAVKPALRQATDHIDLRYSNGFVIKLRNEHDGIEKTE